MKNTQLVELSAHVLSDFQDELLARARSRRKPLLDQLVEWRVILLHWTVGHPLPRRYRSEEEEWLSQWVARLLDAMHRVSSDYAAIRTSMTFCVLMMHDIVSELVHSTVRDAINAAARRARRKRSKN